MQALQGTQQLLTLGLGIAVFLMMLWAWVDCLRTRPDAFVAAGKRTKPLWLALTSVAMILGFIFITNPFNLFNLIAIIAAGVYLADVRPAVKSVRGGNPGTNMGPYGPW